MINFLLSNLRIFIFSYFIIFLLEICLMIWLVWQFNLEIIIIISFCLYLLNLKNIIYFLKNNKKKENQLKCHNLVSQTYLTINSKNQISKTIPSEFLKKISLRKRTIKTNNFMKNRMEIHLRMITLIQMNRSKSKSSYNRILWEL